MNRIITAKFGGTSLADASQIRKAAAIIKSNPERRYVVASAPGKRYSDDIKITDMLYTCHKESTEGKDFSDTLKKIAERYSEIVRELGIEFDIDAEINEIAGNLKNGEQRRIHKLEDNRKVLRLGIR